MTMEDKATEIGLCPFCRSSIPALRRNGFTSYVYCDDCGAHGPTHCSRQPGIADGEAITAWNTRQPSPLAGDVVERVARAICRAVDSHGDTEAVEQQRVDHHWYRYTDHARAALEAASIQEEGSENKTDLSERSASAPEGLTK